MNTALWVIWFALLVAVGFVAFEFGGFFPDWRVKDKIRQEGWDAGFDRGFPHGIRADGGDPDEPVSSFKNEDWCPGCGFANNSAGPCETCGYDRETGEYDEDFLHEQDTDRLTAGGWLRGIERAFGAVPQTGHGPEDYPAPIYDQLATDWRTASSSTPYETSAPAPVAGPPPGDLVAGAEPEPPAPPMVPGEMPGQGETHPHETGGAGADPWQQITAPLDDDPELNEWSIRAERARCHEITRELRELGKALSKPFELTPWKGATA